MASRKFLAKRALDVLISASALIILMPIIALVAIFILFKLGRPVLFRQLRPGLGGAPFVMIKFRTMGDEKGKDGRVLPDVERLRGFGKFLRSTSLDELPELWNVLRGEMSLVGPRPLLMQYLPLYSKDQARRHEVRPGLTGWAQVNGRNNVSWSDKFAYDVWYVDNHTMMLDLKILFVTALSVVLRKDVNADGEATMPVFEGNRSDG